MSPINDAEIVLLRAQIEELVLSLNRWRDTSVPAYKRTILLKNQRQARLEQLLALKAATEDSAKNKSHSDANLWRHLQRANPDIAKRRLIVLQNPRASAKNLCRLLDDERISLPSGWEGNLDAPSWIAAYKVKKLRARIQRIISEDRDPQ